MYTDDEEFNTNAEGEEINIDDWISKCKKILENEGYSVKESYIISEKIKWRPQLFASKEGNRKAIDVRVINELDEIYLEGLSTAVDTVNDVRIFLAFPEKMSIEPDVIKEVYKRKIGILRIFNDKLEIVLEGSNAEHIEKLEKKETLPKKNISPVLLDAIKSVNKIEYAHDLKEFTELYSKKKFASIDEEYKLVLAFITKLFNDKYSKRIITESLVSLKEFEPFLRKGKNYYREHFLHSFQVFLLGAYIIDQNYDIFNKWYGGGFPKQNQIKIDFPWLLTSIFHDVGYPLQQLEMINTRFIEQYLSRRPLQMEIKFEDVQKDEFNICAIRELTCLNKHLNSNEIHQDWVFKSDRENGNGFRTILLKNFNSRNHGVLSALIILKKVSLEKLFENQGYKEGAYSNAVYPAALAMALHDKPIWELLQIRDEIPIKIEKNPLCSLLIFCDNVQEWGRPGTEDTPSVFTLTKIDMHDNTIRITLNCDDFSIATSRQIEYQRVKNVLKSDAFNFEIEVKASYLCQ